MGGRIVRPEAGAGAPVLPEVGRIRIGEKRVGQNGREYPSSVDWFIPSGKYADIFRRKLGDKPQTIQIVFPSDDAAQVCNEFYEYRDNAGALFAKGDGRTFSVWNGQKYVELSAEEYPRVMEQVAEKCPTRDGIDNWKIVLTMRFIIPSVREVVGLWQFSTKGRASSVRNIRDSFDCVQSLRGTVTGTVFDLSVKFAKSNKPGSSSRYPVVSLVANDDRAADILALMDERSRSALLLSGK